MRVDELDRLAAPARSAVVLAPTRRQRRPAAIVPCDRHPVVRRADAHASSRTPVGLLQATEPGEHLAEVAADRRAVPALTQLAQLDPSCRQELLGPALSSSASSSTARHGPIAVERAPELSLLAHEVRHVPPRVVRPRPSSWPPSSGAPGVSPALHLVACRALRPTSRRRAATTPELNASASSPALAGPARMGERVLAPVRSSSSRPPQ